MDTLSCDQSLPVQPISIRKAQSRKKAHKPSRTSHISPQMCLPCLVIVQSCYCDYRINKTFLCSRCLICILDSGHLSPRTMHAKDSGLFIVITHKSTRSENPITWCLTDIYLFICLFLCFFVCSASIVIHKER